MTDVGKAITEHAEQSYLHKVTIYETMLKKFKEMEYRYLDPIARDVKFLSNFVRSGTNGIIEQARAIMFSFQQAINEPTNTNTHKREAWWAEESPATLARTGMGVPNTRVAGMSLTRELEQDTPSKLPRLHTNTGRMIARLPPEADEYSSVLAMYFDWIGMLDKTKSLRTLFKDTNWRRQYCPKNSAVMKRMQRMKTICVVIDNHLAASGLTISHEPRCHGSSNELSTAEDIGACVKDFMVSIFGEEPNYFSWTRYVKEFRAFGQEH